MTHIAPVPHPGLILNLVRSWFKFGTSVTAWGVGR